MHSPDMLPAPLTHTALWAMLPKPAEDHGHPVRIV